MFLAYDMQHIILKLLDQELLKSPEHQPREMEIPIAPKENFIKVRDSSTRFNVHNSMMLTR